MFRVKICGLTRWSDAQAAAAAGADAIGLNFYPGSPRYVTPEQAHAICRDLPPSVARVGVFVNAERDWIRQAAAEVPLDFIQLHGDESPSFAESLVPLAIIRAFRFTAEQLPEVVAYCRECPHLAAILVDAYSPHAFGGTGQRADPAVVAQLRAAGVHLPLLLAGGLTPENVREAIVAATPDGVDTASGVEDSPGIKNPQRLATFISAAREAWSA